MREISLHILDVVQNSIEAGASRVVITVDQDTARDCLTVDIADNGRGMDPETAGRVTDPFVTTRTTRRVGLGLPLLAAAARQSGGTLTVASTKGEGTRVTATFGLTNIDRPPLGDMTSTVTCLLAANPSLDLEYRHRCDGREFHLAAADLRARLGEVGLSEPEVVSFVRDYIDEGLRQVCGKAGSLLP